MAAESDEELTLSFGRLSLTLRRGSRAPPATPPAASPSGPPLHRAVGAVAPVDAESWTAREEWAKASGIAARARLDGERAERVTLPRSTKSKRVYVALRNRDGFVYEPAFVSAAWNPIKDVVHDDAGRAADDAIFCGFASQREAKVYVESAGARWPW